MQKKEPLNQTNSKGIQSTLYNPVRGDMPDVRDLADALREVEPSYLVLPSLEAQVPKVSTKFGMFPAGSAIAVQQKLHADFQINIYDSVPYPSLPLKNVMDNNFTFVLDHKETLMIEDISITEPQAIVIEEKTRLQSSTTLWHDARKNRITASKAHHVFRRQRNFETLVQQLKKRSVHSRHVRCERVWRMSPLLLKSMEG